MKTQHPRTGAASRFPSFSREKIHFPREKKHELGSSSGWGKADTADAIVAFPRRCLQWRGIVALHPLHPLSSRARIYTRGSGAHGRGAASHISRLIVSICRVPSIRQFRHWTVSGPSKRGRPGNRDIIAAGGEGRPPLFVIFARSLVILLLGELLIRTAVAHPGWLTREIADRSGWISKQIVGGWIRENGDYLSSNWGDYACFSEWRIRARLVTGDALIYGWILKKLSKNK